MKEQITFINVADLKDPNDSKGRSYREVNNLKAHSYILGSLLAWKDEDSRRRFGTITKLTRDCDGTPLYTITEDHHGHSDDSIAEMRVLREGPSNE